MTLTLKEVLSELNKCKAPNRYLTFFALEDVAQEILIAKWLYPTEYAQCRAIQYAMRKLRYELHNGNRPKMDDLLKPSRSKHRSNYRRDHNAKYQQQ